MKGVTPNMEMYLKTIFEIVEGGVQPRVKLIAERLGVTMPSVTGALDNLQQKGLVEHNPYGDVTLTAKGRRVACQVKDRNDVISRFLHEVLRLPAATASQEACVLEHVVSARTLERLSEFLTYLDEHAEEARRLLAKFEERIVETEDSDNEPESWPR